MKRGQTAPDQLRAPRITQEIAASLFALKNYSGVNRGRSARPARRFGGAAPCDIEPHPQVRERNFCGDDSEALLLGPGDGEPFQSEMRHGFRTEHAQKWRPDGGPSPFLLQAGRGRAADSPFKAVKTKSTIRALKSSEPALPPSASGRAKSKAVFIPWLLVLLSWTAAFGDEQVRRVQEELRKRNLYFADIDGKKSKEVTAAIRRYQE